jgi:hypothetical protein
LYLYYIANCSSIAVITFTNDKQASVFSAVTLYGNNDVRESIKVKK